MCILFKEMFRNWFCCICIFLLCSFNSLCTSGKRTGVQLKSQWTTIKLQAKKQMSEYRLSAKQTGGGPPPTELPLSDNDISVWLPNEFVIDSNEYDSDVICLKVIKVFQ